MTDATSPKTSIGLEWLNRTFETEFTSYPMPAQNDKATLGGCIVFWDYENVSMKSNYSTRTSSDVVTNFCKSLQSNSGFKCLLSFDAKQEAYARGLELSTSKDFHVRPSYSCKKRKKHARPVQREIVTLMNDELYRIPRWDTVVVISGDSEFLPFLKSLHLDNRQRKWILIHNAQSRKDLVQDQMWSKTIVFDHLFEGIKTDREVLRRKTVQKEAVSYPIWPALVPDALPAVKQESKDAQTCPKRVDTPPGGPTLAPEPDPEIPPGLDPKRHKLDLERAKCGSNYRTVMCIYYSQRGYCRNGEYCSFIH